MKAAIVRGAAEPPVWAEFDAPVCGEGECRITPVAMALSQLARARAAGTHYSVDKTFPFGAGVDGVGRLDNGQRVYFGFPRAPFGTMAEQVVVAAHNQVPLPDTLDDVTAAAIANPGMSSWMALRERARFTPGETVLINGATGGSGILAVQIARYLGAGRIIVCGRNPDTLEALRPLGADHVIALGDGSDPAALEALRQEIAAGVDIVLDYLWGASARTILAEASRAPTPDRPLRFVQIGSISGGSFDLPGAWLRASAIELMGSGIGSVAPARVMQSIGEMLGVVERANLRLPIETAPLCEVSTHWTRDTGPRRLVLTLD